MMVSTSSIGFGTSQCHFFPPWTLHSSIKSYILSYIYNISQYGKVHNIWLCPWWDQFLSSIKNGWWSPPLQNIWSQACYYISVQLGLFTHLLIAIYDLILRIFSQCGGFIIFAYAHHEGNCCLPSPMYDAIHLCNRFGTSLSHFFPLRTLHSPINNSYLWSDIENISQYWGIINIAYAHHEVSFCVAPAMDDGIHLCNRYRD
jgi:hypothetical protein